MSDLIPEGLTQKEIDTLTKCSKEVANFQPEQLLDQAEGHLKRIRMLHARNLHINVRLGKAIVHTFQSIFNDWKNIPPMHAPGAEEWFNISVCPTMMSMIFSLQLVSKTMLK